MNPIPILQNESARPGRRLASFLLWLFVVVLAACSLPPRSRAADVDFKWTDNTSGTGLSTSTRLYEQTATGVVIPSLSGRWTIVATVARTADTDPAASGTQQAFRLVDVAAGPHSYCVRSANSAGESGPSNVVTVLVVTPPNGDPTAATATVIFN